MKKLIIIAPQKKIKKNYKENVILGKWCLKNNLNIIENKKLNILKYHWDDKKKFYNDFLKLNEIYEFQLKLVSKKLNKIHKTKNSKKYWRIIIGPWLCQFIQITFDRWTMISKAKKNYKNLIVNAEYDKINIVPKNYLHFINLMTQDEWNEAIFFDLIINFTNINYNKNPTVINYKNYKAKNLSFLNRALKYLNLNSKKDKYFFIDTYLNKTTLYKTQIKLNQKPKFFFSRDDDHETKVDLILRKTKIFKNNLTFEKILDFMIWRYMPISYLENYNKIIKKVKICKNWPSRPKIIFTSNSHIGDDEFKVWCAEKIKNNSKLIIGQHGGNLTTTLFSTIYKHELKIANKYLTWGKKNLRSKKIIPFYNFKIRNFEQSNSLKNNCLLVLNSFPRYSCYMASRITSSQFLNYIDDQAKFINNVKSKIKKKIILRLHKSDADYGWNSNTRIRNLTNSINFDNGEQNIFKLLRKSRVCISTTNDTTYLETMCLKIPTLIFFNKKFERLSKLVLKDFLKLQENNILFDDPLSLAKHLNFIWDNVDEWWYSKKIQKVVDQFCFNYSFRGKNIELKLSNLFKSL